MYQNHIDTFVNAWNTGNFDNFETYLAQDIKRVAPAPLNSSADNLTELKEVITRFRLAFPDGKVTIKKLYQVDESTTLAEWRFTGTNTGPGDFPPTGKAISVDGCSVSHYADGKIVEEKVYMDVMGMMMQLGIIEVPEEA